MLPCTLTVLLQPPLPLTGSGHATHLIHMVQAGSMSPAAPTNSAPKPTISTQAPLHPILKKPKDIQNEPQKTTRLLLEKADGASIRNPSNPPTPNLSEVPPKNSPPGRQSPKRMVFAANRAGRGSRRRPVFNRRKSSQTSIPKALPAQAHQTVKPDTEEVEQDTPTPAAVKPVALLDPLNACEDDSKALPPSPQPGTGAMTKNITGTWTDDPESASVSAEIPLPFPTGYKYTGPFPRPKSRAHDPLLPHKNLVLHQEIRTVSEDSPAPVQGEHRAEPKDPSLCEPIPVEGTAVPGLEHARRVPMPKHMEDELVNILTSTEPPPEMVRVPRRPWFSTTQTWRPIQEQLFLCEWMLEDERATMNSQTKAQPLVQSGFRDRFQEEFAMGTGQKPAASSLSSSLASLRESGLLHSDTSDASTVVPDVSLKVGNPG